MTATTMQKLRPEFFAEAAPNAMPAPAITIMIQLSQPSNGMNAGIARMRAMSPRRNAMMLAMKLTNDGWVTGASKN
jgi:hypothetical protein